jgi:hypothetical protein
MNIKSKIILAGLLVSMILSTASVSHSGGFDWLAVWADNNKGTPAMLFIAKVKHDPDGAIQVDGPKIPGGRDLGNQDGDIYWHWEDLSSDPWVPGDTYNYVFSYESDGTSYSDTKSVTIDPIPMVSSGTLQPQDEIVRSLTPTFSWAPIAPLLPPRQTCYRIRIADSNFQDIYRSERQLETSLTIPDGILARKTPCFWRVETFDHLDGVQVNNRSVSYWVSFVTTNVIPGGPRVQENQKFSLEGLLSNEELEERLKKMKKNAKGKLQVEPRGWTNLGNPIWLTKMGTGPLKIMIATQMHGKEPLGTEAMLDLIQQLTHSGKPMIKEILANCTIWIVPRVNPDGAEVFQRRNQQLWDPTEFGLLPGTPAPWYYRDNLNDFGFDINRDFNVYSVTVGDLDWESYLWPLPGASWLPGYFVTPEARIEMEIMKEFEPDIFIDLHHQGTFVVGDTNEMCVLSVAGDPNVLLSRQVNEAALRAVKSRGKSVFGNITLYGSGLGTGPTTRSALGVANYFDSAVMLFELRNVGQKSKGFLTEIDKIGVMGILEAAATGELFTLDPVLYDNLPRRGARIAPY